MPQTSLGAYSAPPPLAEFYGPTSTAGEGREEGEEREGERRNKETRKGRRGRGTDGRAFPLLILQFDHCFYHHFIAST